MQNNLDTQRASAAPRRVWVTPELRSLDLRETLTAGIPWTFEGLITVPGPGSPPGGYTGPVCETSLCVS